jgi:hypothetical protein
MKEIQQQIKNCEIKAKRQVATCHIPKCLSCSENKGEKRSHKQHRGSIIQHDYHPGSNTSIDEVNAANVSGYTWQHKLRPTLKKYKNFMIFVDHKTRLVYPSFQESKTASEACRSKCDYEKFAQRYQVNLKSYHADKGKFRSKTFQKATKTSTLTSVAYTPSGKKVSLNVQTVNYVTQHAQCYTTQYHDWTKQ